MQTNPKNIIFFNENAEVIVRLKWSYRYPGRPEWSRGP